MARFLDVHDGYVGARRQHLVDAHALNLANQASEGVTFETAWLDPESGRIFCLSRGPSKEALMRVHERSGHPCSEIYEITEEVN